MSRSESGNIADVLRKRAEQSALSANKCEHQPDAADVAYEALFGSTPIQIERKVTRSIPLDKLHTFHTANIGFKPYSAEQLQALADDINEHGLLESIKVRPDIDGYEILSGHNRVNACRLLSWSKITADIEEMDDNRAIIVATVPNLQHRQRLSPCERAWAFRSLLDANKHQGQRTDLNETTSGGKHQKSDARERVARFFGVKENEVRNTVRLTYLTEPLLQLVDEGAMSITCGAAISFYDAQTQGILYEKIQENKQKLCIAQLNRLKKLCPPPEASACEISNAWNTIFHNDQSSKRMKKIVFQGKKFAPYLDRVNSEQELEELFLEFLKQKFS